MCLIRPYSAISKYNGMLRNLYLTTEFTARIRFHSFTHKNKLFKNFWGSWWDSTLKHKTSALKHVNFYIKIINYKFASYVLLNMLLTTNLLCDISYITWFISATIAHVKQTLNKSGSVLVLYRLFVWEAY